MLKNKEAFKYETPYNILYEVTKMWSNGTVTPIIRAKENRLNICQIKTYKPKQHV